MAFEEKVWLAMLRDDFRSARAILNIKMVTWKLPECLRLVAPTRLEAKDGHWSGVGGFVKKQFGEP